MIFDVYDVVIELTEPMLGTIPKNQEVYAQYIASKAPSPELADEEANAGTVDDLEKSGWTGFHEDGDGLFLYDYAILGFLKEAGNTLKDQLGVRNLRSKIDMFVYVEPRCVRIPGGVAGVLERPLRAMTAQGPRVALARSDYVDAGTRLNFQLKILKNKEVTPKLIRRVLEFGTLKGLGQFRNGSYGRFKVISFEEVKEAKEAS